MLKIYELKMKRKTINFWKYFPQIIYLKKKIMSSHFSSITSFKLEVCFLILVLLKNFNSIQMQNFSIWVYNEIGKFFISTTPWNENFLKNISVIYIKVFFLFFISKFIFFSWGCKELYSEKFLSIQRSYCVYFPFVKVF